MEISPALAFAAGLLSFASPCVLALLPVYLAFLGETAGASAPTNAAGGATAALRGPVLAQALLFVAGFGVVFTLIGVSAGLLGTVLFRISEVRQAAGIAVIVLGLLTTGVFGPVFDRLPFGVKADPLPRGRAARSVALGALVAIGWTPCIGPVLGTILLMGASTQDAGIAAILLVAYSAGLAIPFLAAAVALPRLRPIIEALRRHHRAVAIAAGLFIMVMGVLIYLNVFYAISGIFVFG